PENALLQLATEWGVPGLLLLAVGLWGFGRLLRRAGWGTVELSVLAGVVALGLHDLFDFSLEFPATMVAALVALATVVRPEHRARSEAPASRGLAPPHGLAAGGVLAAVALAALVPGRHTLSAAEEELGRLVAARAPLSEVRARGLVLIDRHPTDYALHDLLGTACVASGPSGATEALAFANRALFLNPLDARAHRVAARALLALGGRTQAFLEYRLAFEAGDREVLWNEALGRARTLDELQALTPDSPREAVRFATELVRAGRHEEALPWLAWARERFDAAPEAVGLWERETRLRLDRRELKQAEAASAEVSRRAPDALASHLLRVDVLRAQERNDEALKFLEEVRTRFPGDVELAFMFARLQMDMGLPRRARETLQRVSPFLSDLTQRARLFMLEGDSFEREGLRARALDSWQTAARLQPNTDAWFRVARLHESMHQMDAAARAVREGVRLLPSDKRAEAEAWAARLEEGERQRVEARRQERIGGGEREPELLRALGSDEDVASGGDEAP
ncbi:MAG TPA: tetratricopeptide repeat protein, partial [Archangium sp.]|uniref:tetratricopeptide repeat protein n=1 Tax=Archangium sp. TaxID=1872627 RepID=UPI002EDA1A1D